MSEINYHINMLNNDPLTGKRWDEFIDHLCRGYDWYSTNNKEQKEADKYGFIHEKEKP